MEPREAFSLSLRVIARDISFKTAIAMERNLIFSSHWDSSWRRSHSTTFENVGTSLKLCASHAVKPAHCDNPCCCWTLLLGQRWLNTSRWSIGAS